MTNVVVMGGGPQPGEPDPDVIAILERLLEQARAGNMRAIGYAAVYGQSMATGWAGGAGTRDTLASSIMILGHRYAAALLDNGKGAEV